MSSIFLSYASGDRARTRLLVEALESRGWTVWWDRTIRPGKAFDQVIEDALAESSCVVVLWSEASVVSDWVKNEAAEAARRRILVPVLIDDVKIPFEFRRIHAARLVGWSGDQTHEEFNLVLQAIAATMGEASDAPRAVPPPPAEPRPPSPPQAPPPTPAPVVPVPVRSQRRLAWKPVALIGGAAVVAALVALWWRPPEPLVVGVMEIRPRGNTPGWMCDLTRDGLNTILSKVGKVQVYSKQKIDLLREKRGLSEIEAAEQLGIAKMISGTISATEHDVALELEIVDIKSGMLEDSERVRGTQAQLIDLQNQAAVEVVRALKVKVSPEVLDKIVATRSNDQLDNLRLLTESMGGFVDEGETPSAPAPKKPGPGVSWSVPWPAVAHAEENAEQAAVRQLLEQYRAALEAKNLERMAAIYVALNDQMRDSLKRYFENAQDLKVRFSNFDILVEGDKAVATFTRNDDFKDANSGRDAHLEVRVSSVVTKQEGQWKILGLKKPS